MKGREIFDKISEDACRELEAIVGPDHMTTDPNLCMATYGFGWGHEVYWFHGVVQPPAAIIMPGSTQEVARIIKLCNRREIPFHPVSQHCIIPGDPAILQNVVSIDLKRMNGIEIDEKNMHVILESGITAAQLSAEANRRDLYYVVTGGGGAVGPLCNQFVFGWGHFCWRASPCPQRRWTGIEWVSPEGEIHRMGSLVIGDGGGFWGDGLGPDMSGLLYGFGAGWAGAMGIVTKIGIKLYPFQPDPLEPKGMGGESGVQLPPRVRYYNITFPDKGSLLNAIDEIGKADIAAVVNVVPAFWRSMSKCRGTRDLRNEFFEAWDPVTPEQVSQIHIIRVLLLGRTSFKQSEYEEKVLLDIVKENSGTPRNTRQVDEGTFRYANTGDMWMMTGCYAMTTAAVESSKCTKAQNELFRDRLAANPQKGDYLDQKGELPWYLMWRRGRDRYTENHIQPDTRSIDPEDPNFNPPLTMALLPWAVSEGPVVNMKTGCQDSFGGITHKLSMESLADHGFDRWNREFKREFDPKGLSGTFWPYAIDKVIEGAPAVETEEAKEISQKAHDGPWMGNPE